MGTEIGEFRLGHPIRILLRVFLLELLVFQRASVRRRRRFHASDLLKRGNNRVVSAEIGTGDRSKSPKEGRFGVRDRSKEGKQGEEVGRWKGSVWFERV
jgi:hypothetical protein